MLSGSRSGALLPPPLPAEKATASPDQAGQARTDDGTGDSSNRANIQSYAPEIVGKEAIMMKKSSVVGAAREKVSENAATDVEGFRTLPKL